MDEIEALRACFEALKNLPTEETERVIWWLHDRLVRWPRLREKDLIRKDVAKGEHEK